MLREVKQLLEERGQASLRELAIHFEMDPSALEPMMQVLVEKGTVKALEAGCGVDGKGCSGCFCADREDRLIYSPAD